MSHVHKVTHPKSGHGFHLFCRKTRLLQSTFARPSAGEYAAGPSQNLYFQYLSSLSQSTPVRQSDHTCGQLRRWQYRLQSYEKVNGHLARGAETTQATKAGLYPHFVSAPTIEIQVMTAMSRCLKLTDTVLQHGLEVVLDRDNEELKLNMMYRHEGLASSLLSTIHTTNRDKSAWQMRNPRFALYHNKSAFSLNSGCCC